MFDVVPVKDTPPEYSAKIMQWADFLSRNVVRVDDSDVEAEATVSNVEKTQF